MEPLSRFDVLFDRHRCVLCGSNKGVTLHCMAISCTARAHVMCISLLQYSHANQRPWKLYSLDMGDEEDDNEEDDNEEEDNADLGTTEAMKKDKKDKKDKRYDKKKQTDEDMSDSHLICLCNAHNTSDN